MCFTVRYSPDRLSGWGRIFRDKLRCGDGCTPTGERALSGEFGGQNGGGREGRRIQLRGYAGPSGVLAWRATCRGGA